MTINQLLPFLSTAVMLWFTVDVFKRYLVRRNPAFLFWAIGLAMFGIGSFAEAYLSLTWNKWIFFAWYLFGAALNAMAWAWNFIFTGAQKVAPRCHRCARARKFIRRQFDVASHAQIG